MRLRDIQKHGRLPALREPANLRATMRMGPMTLARLSISLGALMFPLPLLAVDAVDDPFLWLEEVSGEQALAWVEDQNAECVAEITQSDGFQANFLRLLAIFDSEERIPYISKAGEHYYNFWRDAQHPRGLWRRTSLDQYQQTDPVWETVLDLDALAESRVLLNHGDPKT